MRRGSRGSSQRGRQAAAAVGGNQHFIFPVDTCADVTSRFLTLAEVPLAPGPPGGRLRTAPRGGTSGGGTRPPSPQDRAPTRSCSAGACAGIPALSCVTKGRGNQGKALEGGTGPQGVRGWRPGPPPPPGRRRQGPPKVRKGLAKYRGRAAADGTQQGRGAEACGTGEEEDKVPELNNRRDGGARVPEERRREEKGTDHQVRGGAGGKWRRRGREASAGWRKDRPSPVDTH